jgi:PAS domain S-box-containing protein
LNIVPLLSEAILQTTSDAIVATDREGLIRFWNPGASRIFGFSAEEAIGRSVDLIIPENLRARHWEGFRHVMATGRSRYGEGDLLAVPGLTKQGTRISLEFTISMLWDEAGGVAGVVSILRDVTQRFEELRSLRKRLAGTG